MKSTSTIVSIDVINTISTLALEYNQTPKTTLPPGNLIS